MNLVTLLAGVALFGAVVLGMQGADKITGGELYLSSIAHLAQETTNSLPQAEPATTVQPATPTTDVAQPTTSGEQRVIMPIENQVQNIIGQPIQQEGQPIQTEVIRQPIDRGQMEKPPMDDGKRNQIMDERDMMAEEGNGQNYIDPREIQQVTREIKQLNTEIKRTRAQLKRYKAATSDTEELNVIVSEIAKIQSVVTNKSADNDELWEAVDEFRNGQYWDRMNKIRAKVEIPNEAKQITQNLKRLEKVVNTKAMRNLGFDMTKVKATVEEMKQNLAVVQSAIAAGNLEEAMEAMQYFREGGHPGEIESTLFRVRDIKNMTKQVKDKDIQAEVNNVLQEVIDSFNEGNYRDARETLDEYQDDIMSLVSKLAKTKAFKGQTKTDTVSKIQNLENMVNTKLNEREAVREQKQ